MSSKERKDPKESPLDAPLLSFVLAEQIEQLQNEPQWLSGDRNSITLAKSLRLRQVSAIHGMMGAGNKRSF